MGFSDTNQTHSFAPSAQPTLSDEEKSQVLDDITFRIYYAVINEISNNWQLRANINKKLLDNYISTIGVRLTEYGES